MGVRWGSRHLKIFVPLPLITTLRRNLYIPTISLASIYISGIVTERQTVRIYDMNELKRAMTNAERQKAYRERRKRIGDRVEIRAVVSKETADRLRRLAQYEPTPGSLPVGDTVAEVISLLAQQRENKMLDHANGERLKSYFGPDGVPEEYRIKL